MKNKYEDGIMNILIVSNEIIPVRLYGGTGRVIWFLGKELSKMRNNITYLVSKGSSCDFGNVIYLDNKKQLSEQIPDNIDIIHFNFTPKYIHKIKNPYVITMHGNTNTQNELDINTIFLSKNHANRYRSDSFVYNGLDWDDYMNPSFSIQRKYFHFLGNASWRLKNLKGAINVIKRTKSEKIKILGGTRLNIKMGLRFTLSSHATFHGMLGGKQKDNLLKYSKGLIFPIRWHEPFGLAIIESLYFGCPIFGTPYGSLPELVIKDVGFLSTECDKIAHELINIDKYSNKHCHDYAVEKFNSKNMALSYLEKYEKVISGKNLNEKPPKLKKVQENKFLEWIE